MTHYTKPPGKQCINSTTIQKIGDIIKSLKYAFLANPAIEVAQQRWDTFSDTTHSTALNTEETKQDTGLIESNFE